MTKAGEQPTITQADHEVIYLAPKCFGVERSWCKDAGVEDCDCIDGPHDWIKFTRTSLAAQDGLVEALEKVRKCAVVVPSIFPDTPPSVSWIVSELTKILPEMDAALSAIKGDK